MMSSPWLRPAALGLGALAAALCLLGCTSAGDGGVGQGGATFTSNTPPGGNVAYVYMQQAGPGRTSLCLDVGVQFAQDLYSISFTLAYDPSVLRFATASQTAFLGTAGQTLMQVDDVPPPPAVPDQVVVGLTRRSDVVTTGVTGNGTVLTLCFDVVGTGSSNLTFTGNLAGQDPSGAVVIPPTSFVSGSVTVQ